MSYLYISAIKYYVNLNMLFLTNFKFLLTKLFVYYPYLMVVIMCQ